MLETGIGLVIWGMFVVVTLSDILIPLRDGSCISSCKKVAFQQEPIWFSLVITIRVIILLFVVVLYALIIDDVLIG